MWNGGKSAIIFLIIHIDSVFFFFILKSQRRIYISQTLQKRWSNFTHMQFPRYVLLPRNIFVCANHDVWCHSNCNVAYISVFAPNYFNEYRGRALLHFAHLDASIIVWNIYWAVLVHLHVLFAITWKMFTENRTRVIIQNGLISSW